MKFQLSFKPERFPEPVLHQQRIFLIGSCFTESIGDRLARLKFHTIQNPHGILYNPISITNSLVSYIDRKKYSAADLVYLNDLWQSWDHHGSFSGPDQLQVIERINKSQEAAYDFLGRADWIFITLGSAFSYKLAADGREVANCHKAPAKAFSKAMLTIEEIKSSLDTCIHRLLHFKRSIKIIFTVSPVRYVRDGLVNNNVSKARLMEVVHHLVNKFSGICYFPAYELVNDVLRDYRFFKEDMVHPSSQAIDYVFDSFAQAAFDESTAALVSEIDKIQTALEHRALHPGTAPYTAFRETVMRRVNEIKTRYPYINFSTDSLEELPGT
jgi:GSCFA family protein